MDLVIIKNYFLPLVGSFIVALIITKLVRDLALKFKIVDAPTEPRKVHKQPVPMLGGLAVYLTFVLVTIVFYQAGLLLDGRIQPGHILGIILGGLFLMFGGWLDDKYRLKPGLQLIWPVLAALTVILSGMSVSYITNPLGGLLNLGGTVWSPLLIFFWLLGMMYTTKFLDGLDGLVAGVAVIGSVILFIISLFWDVPMSGTSILCLILAGACLGFLIWNFHPARIFLGEGGSLFIGFMLGVLAIVSGAKIATALLIMGIPILDVIWVIVRRIFKDKKSVWLADRKHLHFRLLDAGFNHSQAVIFLYFLTLIFGASAIFQQTVGKLVSLGILLLVMVILALWLMARYKSRSLK
ncbi:MAG TPA: MraY family glycosyltransferase [Patescibacteria group bacterium]|nr:MraY family glycosyltransferase [Patescibacteria group bacterium]